VSRYAHKKVKITAA